MSDEFTWDQESTVIASVSAVAVYQNTRGDIVIRQESPMGEEDSLVIIPRDRVADLILAIQNALAD